MSSLDILVCSGLAAAAIIPPVWNWLHHCSAILNIRGLLGSWVPRLPAAVVATDNAAAWRSKWTSTLVSLLNDIKAGLGGPTGEAELLTKQLIWELMGGDQKAESKRRHA